MSEHILDRDVKSILGPSHYQREVFLRYAPDWAWQEGSNIGVIEYENSSRGCLTHVAKYLYLAQQNPACAWCVHIIRSKHHQNTHHSDFLLSDSMYMLGVSAGVKNLFLTFLNCDNTSDTLIGSRNVLMEVLNNSPPVLLSNGETNLDNLCKCATNDYHFRHQLTAH